MGYWSEHPMGGDTPMDMRDELLGRYDDYNNGPEYYFERDDLKTLIERDIDAIVAQAEKDKANHALPFIIVENGVSLRKDLITRVKNMIMDGNGCERGYHQKRKATPQNGWNGLKCPQDYCDQLRFYFRDISAGKVGADVLKECKGLLQTIGEHVSGGNTGLVNVN